MLRSGWAKCHFPLAFKSITPRLVPSLARLLSIAHPLPSFLTPSFPPLLLRLVPVTEWLTWFLIRSPSYGQIRGRACDKGTFPETSELWDVVWLSEEQVEAFTQAERMMAILGILLPSHSSLPKWLCEGSQVAFPMPVDERKFIKTHPFLRLGIPKENNHWVRDLGAPGLSVLILS